MCVIKRTQEKIINEKIKNFLNEIRFLECYFEILLIKIKPKKIINEAGTMNEIKIKTNKRIT